MVNILRIMLGTPWWVWGLLAYLIYIGYSACFSRTVSFYRLFILPSVFIIWSFLSFYNKGCLDQLLLLGWAILFILGILAGYYLMSKVPVKIKFLSNSILVPGSVLPLVMSLVFFMVKYGMGVASAIAPHVASYFIFQLSAMGISGLISGMTLGRSINLLVRFKAHGRKN